MRDKFHENKENEGLYYLNFIKCFYLEDDLIRKLICWKFIILFLHDLAKYFRALKFYTINSITGYKFKFFVFQYYPLQTYILNSRRENN